MGKIKLEKIRRGINCKHLQIPYNLHLPSMHSHDIMAREVLLMPRILIVEDDFAISELVMMNLSIAGYECDAAYDGAEALKAIEQQEYDLALLDVMLPEKDGFELMPYMQIHAIPAIYVSAKAEVTDRIKGLRLGAEDYITKPFDIVELQLRVEKVLSRVHPHPRAYTVEGVLIDEEKRTASINNQYIDLRPKEFNVEYNKIKCLRVKCVDTIQPI